MRICQIQSSTEEPINVWRGDLPAMRRQISVAHIIGIDDNDVGALCRWEGLGKALMCQGTQQERGS